MKKIILALAGNPNCGKTTLFNGLTGLRHHTGNWPGKTVSIDRNEGRLTYKGYTFDIIDLPGIYSLSSRTLEEEIAAEYFTTEKPDVVVNIIDAGNLEKNLFLTLQLIEIGAPVVVALNMNEFAEGNGLVVDATKLSAELGVPVVKIEAINKTGRTNLLDAVIDHKPVNVVQFYDEELESHLSAFAKHGASRWEALQELIHPNTDESSLTFNTRRHLEKEYGGRTITEVISTQKYHRISEIVERVTKFTEGKRRKVTEILDKIFMNRIAAIPIFFLIMFMMFQIVFALGNPLAGGIWDLFKWLGGKASIVLTGAPDWIRSLLVDGIIGGLGSVIIFLPNIILMFLMLAILENSGYLARVAVIMDGIMKKIGLHGKSSIPMILGFGCGVPAIMASRTLENERSKKLTMLLTPFMSCSARLPIYVLFTTAFFAQYQGLVLFAIYTLGILIALLVGFILRKTAFKGEDPAFIIEIPSYHVPIVRDVLLTMWDNAKEFLKRAGVIIFPAVLFVWLLASTPFGVEYSSAHSVLGKIGSFIAPLFTPLGFGFMEAGISLIMGLLSKEVIIGSLGTLLAVGSGDLTESLQHVFSPLSALSFLIFCSLYVPCLATLFTIKKEAHSWSFTLLAGIMYIMVAWFVSFIVFQGGTLLGF
ncbi:MAG TPA: ferrous iron transport protein B [Methanocorpusculum sp.]|nr:ferrous iron transport protein B [Methanocorpusculum sp.]